MSSQPTISVAAVTQVEPAVPAASTGPAVPRSRDARRRDVPVLVFRIVAAICIAFVVTGPGGARFLLSPWVSGPAVHFELHRWHATDLAVLVNLLVAGSLLVCAIAPRRTVVAGQAFLGAVMSLAVLSVTMPDPAPALVPSLVLAVLFVASLPARRGLVGWHGGGGRRAAAVAAAALSTPFLLFNAGTNIAHQLAGLSEHAAFGHWAGAAALAVALLLAGGLAAAGGPGAGPLAAVLAVTWLYLGVAALTLQGYDGSWGIAGAMVALVTGALFAAVPLTGRRADSRDAHPLAADS